MSSRRSLHRPSPSGDFRQKRGSQKQQCSRGFTLAEMAIVLIIVLLIVSGMVIPFGAQVQNKRIAETRKTLDEIKEALMGFAIVNKRLPCPAQGYQNGVEAAICSTSSGAASGFVPWTTLGINKVDSWGKLIQYSVSPGLTTTPVGINITSTGGKTIKTRDSGGALVDEATGVAVVIYSHGARNFGYFETGTGMPDSSSTNTDEETNALLPPSTYNTYINRPITDVTTAAGGEFDDIVAWIPMNLIISRMVAAGQLP